MIIVIGTIYTATCSPTLSSSSSSSSSSSYVSSSLVLLSLAGRMNARVLVGWPEPRTTNRHYCCSCHSPSSCWCCCQVSRESSHQCWAPPRCFENSTALLIASPIIFLTVLADDTSSYPWRASALGALKVEQLDLIVPVRVPAAVPFEEPLLLSEHRTQNTEHRTQSTILLQARRRLKVYRWLEPLVFACSLQCQARQIFFKSA